MVENVHGMKEIPVTVEDTYHIDCVLINLQDEMQHHIMLRGTDTCTSVVDALSYRLVVKRLKKRGRGAAK